MITQDQLVDYLKNVKVGELQALITTLEDELGVTASQPPMIPQQPQTPVVEDKTEFDVVLTGFEGKKVAVIKAVRTLTGLGLKEAKAAVEEAPTVIREAVSKEAAEEAAEALREKGGTVEVR